ncbi:hypothetical protein [Mesoterricola sediminis]|uniref:Uncharacterized protein n=1 Tax=Mesoterricola sediminis TaxID=2927980 RepID=A0AA48KC52_9BACT|nr:hypothetical protein [Mesoterricola sediminis]BDU75725.1 hypothetical protein METESE_06830 [Mesoterricola sediminis]
MNFYRLSCILLLGCSILGAAVQGEDPVQKARAERARAQGVAEGDLPPVPRGIVEPPPLPPPETHLKDTPRGKVAKTRKQATGSKAARAKGAKATKGAKAVKEPGTAVAKKHPAKGGRRSSKKGKG